MRLAIQASPEQRVPFIWFWPKGHASCAIMTHDVETEAGLQFTHELMTLNDTFAVKSSFQLIPDARYTVTRDVLKTIKNRGFEVNVHDLKHDGYLFANERQFRQQAARINAFAHEFGSQGFRSGVLYRNQEWFDAFDVAYDMSVPNVAKLDPQPGGCCTIMPFFIGNLLELPVTATQDYSLFHVLGTHSQDLWDQQIEEITQHHGLLNFIVHPDYLNTPQALAAYTELLRTLSDLRSTAGLWICLPGELNTWWRQRNEMCLVVDQGGWKIEGDGSDQARLAYASLHDDTLRYCFA